MNSYEWQYWNIYTNFSCHPNSGRPGEVVVITGGPRGISYELAKKFLQLDFIVIMGARDVKASQVRVDQMREQGVINGKIHLLPLNLKSLAATKEFAIKVLELTSRIDILINNGKAYNKKLYINRFTVNCCSCHSSQYLLYFTNKWSIAGIMMTPYECTVDGYESQFQVNYLSHYLLTTLLLPTIKQTALDRSDESGCRIINTTSTYHLAGSLDFDDLETR